MQPIDDLPLARRLRIVLVGTGTGVGKTHVASALLAAWSERAAVVGLKPVETGVSTDGAGAAVIDDRRAGRAGGRAGVRSRGPSPERQGRIPGGASVPADGRAAGGGPSGKGGRRMGGDEVSDQRRLATAAQLFHVKRSGRAHPAEGQARATPVQPVISLYAFPEPVSPHLAARDAGARIDLGLIERWVASHEAPVTVVETAGGLFSPLGHGVTNFDLTRALRPDAAILVASDRLGILHELTTTLSLAAARGGPPIIVVLSAPAKRDASTGRNAQELAVLGIAQPLAVFPRADVTAAETLEAARRLIDWIERGTGAARQ